MDVRVQKTYQLLNDALMRLLKEKSFEDLSVIEICEAAGVHRATFYKHFVDKYDFLNACFKQNIDKLSFGKLEDTFTPDSMRRNINRMIANTLAYVEENRAFLRAVDSDKYSTSFNDILTQAIADFIMDRLSMKKQVKETIGPQLPMIANYYAGGAVGLIKWWSKGENLCSVQEFFAFVQPRIIEFTSHLFHTVYPQE